MARPPVPLSGAPRVVLQLGHGRDVKKVALSRNERVAASAAEDVRFWDTTTGALISRWGWEDVGAKDDKLDFEVLAVSPNGQRAVAATRTLYLIDVPAGRTIGTYHRTDPRRWISAAFAPDGKSLLASSDDGKLEIFDVSRWQLIGILGRHAATEVEFSADGKDVVTRSAKQTIYWDFLGRQVRRREPGSPKPLQVAEPSVTGAGGHTLTAKGKSLFLARPASTPVALAPSLSAIDGVVLGAPGLAVTGSTQDGALNAWDLPTLARLPLPSDLSWPATLDAKERRLLAWSRLGNGEPAVAAVDLASLRTERRYALPRGLPRPVHLSLLPSRDRLVVVFATPPKVLLLDLETGGTLEQPLEARVEIAGSTLAANGRRLVVGRPEGLHSWDLVTGTHQFVEGDFEVPHLGAFFADPRYLLAVTLEKRKYMDYWKQFLEAYDSTTGQVVRSMEVALGSGGALAVRPDGRRALVGSVDGRIREYDLDNALLVRTLAGHAGQVRALAVDAEGRFALSGAEDGAARLWRLDTGDSVMLVARGDDWVIADDRGYFDATRNGARLLAVVSGLEAFALDTVVAPWNRPDLLLAKMSLGTPEVQKLLEKKYKDRVKSLRLEDSARADVRSGPRVEGLQTSCQISTCRVDFQLLPGNEPVLQYQIMANGVPVVSRKLDPPATSAGPRTDTVQVTPGSNRIEVVAMDASGVESRSAFRTVDVASQDSGERYFVGFGVDDYQDPLLSRLQYAVKDVRDLATVLEGPTERAHVHVRLFANQQVSRRALDDAASFLSKARPEDVAVVFVAGHGLHSVTRGEFMFLGAATRMDDLESGGLPLSAFHELLEKTPARRRILLLDACESGDRDEGESAAAGAAPTTARARSTRAAQVILDEKPRLQRLLSIRERLIFEDLGRRNGAVVFASSRGTEASYEDPALENGVFTHFLKTLLREGRYQGDTLDSFEEIRRAVEREVPRHTGDRQHPVLLRSNPFVDIMLTPRARPREEAQ